MREAIRGYVEREEARESLKQEAQVRRFYHIEKWRVGTIAPPSGTGIGLPCPRLVIENVFNIGDTEH